MDQSQSMKKSQETIILDAMMVSLGTLRHNYDYSSGTGLTFVLVFRMISEGTVSMSFHWRMTTTGSSRMGLLVVPVLLAGPSLLLAPLLAMPTVWAPQTCGRVSHGFVKKLDCKPQQY